jgi:hypothetical protein
VGERPTRQNAPAGSNRSNCGGNEAVEASGGQRVTKDGDVASVQAVMRMNAEQASKRTMRGPTRSSNRGRLLWLGEQEQKRGSQPPRRGMWRRHVHKESVRNTGSLMACWSDEQPDARERWSGRHEVTERFVVPVKPRNSGGGKGPQFKTDARSSVGVEIGQPSNSN